MENIEPPPLMATAVARVGHRVILLRLEAKQLMMRDPGDLITAQILKVIPSDEIPE